MKGKYLRRIGGLILTALLLTGIAFASPSDVQAQGRRRVVIVRPIRPFGFGPWWGYPYGPYGWGYGSYYSRYVFYNGDEAVNQGYNDGFKTGRDDGKKAKSYDPQRSHYFRESGFGNFAETYRTGFSRGYQEGYRAGGNERTLKERAG
ncbi:MAG TPA: hypothetical protein VGJ37_01115 [Pyrinomonadaceae bacterium]|jgi:hypothetical protein